jgi:hypothetical protein
MDGGGAFRILTLLGADGQRAERQGLSPRDVEHAQTITLPRT